MVNKSCKNCITTTSDDWHELRCQNEESDKFKKLVEDDDCCSKWEGVDPDASMVK